MAQKIFDLPEIGELIVAKRRGSKNIRLSITPAGKVRVGIPAWAPYSMGVNFAAKRLDWIKAHLDKQPQIALRNGDRIGKSYRIKYVHQLGRPQTSTRISGQALLVTSGLPFEAKEVQRKALLVSERALKKEAQTLLPGRLDGLADRHGFTYQSVKVKRLVSRWGSCSNSKVITLNYFLMQLPWELIDYVILHELVHTKHLNHSAGFWNEFESIYPSAKKLRRQIKDYRPIINGLAQAVT